MKVFLSSIALLALLGTRLPAGSTVVFNEIMYHPLERNADLEWLELHNQMAADMDISGWSLGDGVFFSFPEGTIVPGGGYLVVASNPAALEMQTGYGDALGPFEGRLENSGETLRLFNNSRRLMDRVSYGDSADWPAAPDGSGVSLAKIDPQSASALSANWAPSVQQGGSPGMVNFTEASHAASTLAFNETLLSPQKGSWLEIVNHGAEPADLDGFVLVSQGTVSGEFRFPAKSLGGNAYHVLSEAELGFSLEPGNRLFLYTPSRERVASAVHLQEDLHGRFPGGTGRWLVPESETPGAENRFAFHDEIAINEIMYHQKSRPAGPADYEFTPLLPLDAVWRYDATGEGRTGPAWRQADFDDASWAEGMALFYNESSELPAAKTTLLPLGFAAYYFRAEFNYPGAAGGGDLALRPIVDDGAVVYLNGEEILRLNMPDGDIGPETLARRSVANANFSAPVVVPEARLLPGRNVVAVEVHQSRVSSNDIVFGLELLTARLRRPARSFSESPEEWVELYNRSSAAVDLDGWRLSEGIRYVFPPGTLLGPGEYLVVASDRVSLELRYPEIRILGDFTGSLSNRGEVIRLVDDLGNPADEVPYRDDGRWPLYADGGGSSLELREPRADNSKGEAWAASDETSKTEWQTFSYRAVTQRPLGPTLWNEFVFGLLDAGEILLDDVSVIELPAGAARELLQNGDFEQAGESWRFLGNHRRSQVVADPDDPQNHVLHVVATGPTEHMHNHVETTLVDDASVLTSREYEIRFRARWLAGSSQLHTRLYFNRNARVTLLPVNERAGTPGMRNSAYEENIGPTFDLLSHRPVVPGDGEAVTVRIQAADPDGVKACRLFTSVDGGAWTSRPMSPDAGGLHVATVLGEPPRRVVHFYIEAEDNRGAVSTYPPGGSASRALYRVGDDLGPLGTGHRVRLIMTSSDVSLLRTPTNVMSNEPVGCTVVYDDREVFYDVGVRLKGSEMGRTSDVRRGFNVRLHREHLFRQVHHSIHLDRPVGPKKFGRLIRLDEVLFKHMANHAGGIPSMYDDVAYFVGPWDEVTGTALLSMARFTKVFLESQYEKGEDGTLWKYELIYYATKTTGGVEGLKLPVPAKVIGVDLQDLGDDKEAYRWNWLIRNHRDRDDYAPIIRCCKAFDLTGEALETAAKEAIDVDEWMRAFALVSLAGVWDFYTFGLEHNVLFFERPADELVEVFPLDTDHTFYAAPTSPLVGNKNLSNLIRRPANLRAFYFHIQELIESTYNADYMARWISHFGELAREDFSPILDYIRERGEFALERLPEPPAFAITTNHGESFSVPGRSVLIEGAAGIDVRSIVLADRELLVLSFPALTTWRATAPLSPGDNQLEFLAFDQHANLLDSDAITVTSLAEPGPRFIRGDFNLDGKVNISDCVLILDYLFAGAAASCEDAGDLDDNEVLELTDAVVGLNFLFLGGNAPPQPYPDPGEDASGDGELGCESGLDAADN